MQGSLWPGSLQVLQACNPQIVVGSSVGMRHHVAYLGVAVAAQLDGHSNMSLAMHHQALHFNARIFVPHLEGRACRAQLFANEEAPDTHFARHRHGSTYCHVILPGIARL